MDIMSSEKRSKLMSKIKSKETKCEIALRRALYAKGLRGYRKNARLLRARAFSERKYLEILHSIVDNYI